MNEHPNDIGISICLVITAILACLKFAGIFPWGWIVVISPLPIYIGVFVFLIALD
jgi:hypothetical protein